MTARSRHKRLTLPLQAGLSHVTAGKLPNVPGLHGSRRPLWRAPHHEGLISRRKARPHPEGPPQAGVSKDGPQVSRPPRLTSSATWINIGCFVAQVIEQLGNLFLAL